MSPPTVYSSPWQCSMSFVTCHLSLAHAPVCTLTACPRRILPHASELASDVAQSSQRLVLSLDAVSCVQTHSHVTDT